MKTTPRFEIAIQKLYTAFHDHTLNPECCKQCAVGNILGNTDAWKHLSDHHGSTQLNYVGTVHQRLGKTFCGYTPIQILTIEFEFLKGCGYQLPFHHKNSRPDNPTHPDTLFKGLCAVINYLCELDGIYNIMDYSMLLRYESEELTSIAI